MPRKPTSTKKDEIVVFWIGRETSCVECGEGLGQGRFLRLEGDRPLCLACADLSHLVFLSRGDAALTRRARKYSKLNAVVVRFSRTRKRYERQGILVEEHALERRSGVSRRADARARTRERAAERRADLNQGYVAVFTEHVGTLYPGCPKAERTVIAEHACLTHSGRIGRTAAAKRFEGHAVELAVCAHVRHTHTRYDELLSAGWDRGEARGEVAAAVDRLIETWQEPAVGRARSIQS